MFVVTSNQMYQAECSAVKRGTTFPKLMEDAGSACADIIRKNYCIGKPPIVIGGGKIDGGDDFGVTMLTLHDGKIDIKTVNVDGDILLSKTVDA